METSNIDGETNLKLKESVGATAGIIAPRLATGAGRRGSVGDKASESARGLGQKVDVPAVSKDPTLAEANKYAAGVWKKSTVTSGQHAFLGAFQAWRRGAGGLGAVLGRLLAMGRDRRPAYKSGRH